MATPSAFPAKERVRIVLSGMAVVAMEMGTVSELLAAIAWPIVLVGLAIAFYGPITKLLAREDVSVTTPGGFSIAAKGRQAATNGLLTAAATRGDAMESSGTVEERVDVASAVRESLDRPPRLLWVDDHPSNNRYERAAFEALDILIDLSTSTDDALARVRRDGPYDVVISDMKRPEGDQAGYALLKALRAEGVTTPFVIYASSRAPEYFDEAVRRGAIGCTNSPTELLQMVTGALRRSAAHSTRQRPARPPMPPATQPVQPQERPLVARPAAPSGEQPGEPARQT